MLTLQSLAPYKCITYYSNSQDAYLKVWLNEMPALPYVVKIEPHPTCQNHSTYRIGFDITPGDIQSIDTGTEFAPGDWLYPTICQELSSYLTNCLDPALEEQLIKEELELCLA